MTKKVFNEHQQLAIESRNKSIVVSAAAGSGKTSVLTERVLGLIEQGEDIEHMLIVTFTNLAASEMKERIYTRLSQAGIEKNQPRLSVQAEKSIFSHISTIHVFCNSVVRDNFEYAGVSPTFSVAGEAQAAHLKQKALDQAVADYTGKADSFMYRYAPRGSAEGIKNIVNKIFSRVISTADPEQWLADAKQNFSSNDFVLALFEEFRHKAADAAKTASEYLKQRSEAWEQKGFYEEAKSSENERIAILRSLNSLDIYNVTIPEITLPEKRSGAPYGVVKTLSGKADKCLEDLRALSGNFYNTVKQQQMSTASDAATFIDITQKFMKYYAKLKREQNVLDHDDSLHMAMKVLKEDAISERYRQKYTHVFVDEYQDINNIQNAIISRVKRSSNDFFVGDVKQCIYMFRESNPELLLRRCSELTGSGLIEMNTNYRSSPEIIDFINSIMSAMMSENIGGVSYSGGHSLVSGTDGEGEVKIIIPFSDNTAETEALAIADSIDGLLSFGFSFSDIAILRPEVSADGVKILRRLSDFGIPVASGFETANPEFSDVSVYINLLKVIDGSNDDVSLLSVLRYPYFGFTEPEFAAVRIYADKTNKDLSFEDALRSYDESSVLGDKIKCFFEKTVYYRLLSDSLSLSDFLMRLAYEAGFFEYAVTAPTGKDKLGSILNFISSAGKTKHISAALEIADRIINTQNSSSTKSGSDSVFFTTIHKSKGLEFPAVILTGLHKRINQTDASSSVLIGRRLGLALDISDTETHIKTPTLHKKLVSEEMRKEKICETVRLLYVGMTRAKKKLIICGVAKKIRDQWSEEKQPDWQLEAGTYLDLVMPALRLSGLDADALALHPEYEPRQTSTKKQAVLINELFRKAEETALPDIPKAYHPKIRIPSKLSVSQIKRQSEPALLIPSFLSSEDGVSAAKRGTLMHKVLQKIGLDKKTPEEVKAFIDELCLKGVTEPDIIQTIDADSISRFLSSNIAKRAKAASKCLFEAPFCLEIAAHEAGVADSSERVIVQGVIDLCFIEDCEWVIIDYKSDSVTQETVFDAANKYKVQLSLYAKALTRITNIGVKEKAVYFLKTGQKVSL